jgi:hypothetical protein
MKTTAAITLETSSESLGFDGSSGRLVSFHAAVAPDQEFITSAAEHPVFALQYLDERREHQRLDSRSAQSFDLSLARAGDGATLTMKFRRVGGLDLDVTAVVRASRAAPLSRWGITVRNGAGLRIVDVQFPFVVCGYSLGGTQGAETIVLPHDFGRLVRAPTSEKLGPDAPIAWQFTWRNGGFNHYPGGQFAQFVAYHNDRAGIYLATEDTMGHVKRFRCLHREPGIRLGVSHVGDWPASGERTLEYDTVLGNFAGDWRDAAALYRGWSLRQKWAVPLSRRTDVPAWLLDSPVHITIRPQGIVDAGPVLPVAEFLPWEKCVPLLERISERVAAPLVAVIMGWEHAGSWVYPDCFPPVGGDDSVTRFARACREKGWKVGSFCNGTRWVVGHCWNDYDGRGYYRERDGERSVSREADGKPWFEIWDTAWRPSILQCSAAPMTREIATAFVKRLLSWGLESIQFFDQNCGAATFPCFAEDHGHPPLPGRWMAEAMEEMVAGFRRAAEAAGETEVIQSVEMCCNEYALQLFQQSDSRVRPPGHVVETGDVIPLYQFLFHECIVMHGMMSPGPEPWHLEIANAANGVLGEIPGGVLTGAGTLLDKDTYNWALWEPKVGDPDRGLEMIRAITSMRRGPGRDWLVLGRMHKSMPVAGVKTVQWTWEGKARAIPAVFDCTWESPDGRFAVALANWTDRPQTVRVAEERLGEQVTEHCSARGAGPRDRRVRGGTLKVKVPPLSMVLVEQPRASA